MKHVISYPVQAPGFEAHHGTVQTALGQTLCSTSCSAGTSSYLEENPVLDKGPVPNLF